MRASTSACVCDRPPRPADVVVVALDRRSFDLLGERPPIPRSLHARLLDRLRRFEPRVIAYDVQFTEPTRGRDEDEALYNAVSRARPVVLATSDVTVEGDTRVLGSTANVAAAGGFVASSRLPLSRGGVYRRVERRVAGLESLAFVAARVGGSQRPRPASGRTALLIDYAGPPGTVRTVSFADVLDGRVPGAVFRDKAVVVGVTAETQGDLHRTPMASHELMAGAEIQANALSTVMRGVPLRDAPAWIAAALVAMLRRPRSRARQPPEPRRGLPRRRSRRSPRPPPSRTPCSWRGSSCRSHRPPSRC